MGWLTGQWLRQSAHVAKLQRFPAIFDMQRRAWQERNDAFGASPLFQVGTTSSALAMRVRHERSCQVGLNAFAVDNRRAALIILALRDPHLLEGAQR